MKSERLILPLILLACMTCFAQAQLADKSDCGDVKTYFNGMNIGDSILMSAQLANNSNVCNVGGYTCCSSEANKRIVAEGMKDFQRVLQNHTKETAMHLRDQGGKGNKFVLNLLDGARENLDQLFSGTYGDPYTNNKDVFDEFFDALKTYYEGATMDLSEIFDNLFSALTRIAFQLYSYEVNEQYAQCIGDNINIIKPCADTPKKLESQVQRSFLAMRTYLQALAYGQHLIESTSKMLPTLDIMKKYANMTYCAKCAGYVDQSPCQSFCENTMNNILCNIYGDFNGAWLNYLHAMNALLDRIKGPFNIDAAISPLNVQISGCVMTLQDNDGPIKDALQRNCGPLVQVSGKGSSNGSIGAPTKGFQGLDLSALANINSELGPDLNVEEPAGRSKRSARSSQRRRQKKRRSRRTKSRSSHKARHITGSIRSSFPHHRPVKSRQDLESLTTEMGDTLNSLKRFWRSIPDNVCSTAIGATSGQCWDGNKVIPRDVTGKEIQSRCSACAKPDPRFSNEIRNLKEMTSKLVKAYRGIDTAMPDDDVGDYFSDETSGDGSGDRESSEDGDTEEPDCGSAYHPQKPVDKHTDNSKVSDSLLVTSLEDWEVDILEAALGRPIGKTDSLKDLKQAILERHSQLKSKQGKESVKVANLTSNQLDQLKKILGIKHKSGSTDSNAEGRNSGITDANVVKTTSAGYRLRSCPILLFVTFIFFSIPC